MTLTAALLAFGAIFAGLMLGALRWYGLLVAVYVWPRPLH